MKPLRTDSVVYVCPECGDTDPEEFYCDHGDHLQLAHPQQAEYAENRADNFQPLSATVKAHPDDNERGSE